MSAPLFETFPAGTIPDTVSASLDASGAGDALLPYLPYLLQDLFELGSSPEATTRMVREQGLAKGARVLDLGCGKGAVALRLARELGVQVLGIDGLPAFVDEANARARREGLEGLCRFESGDLRLAARSLTGFDCTVFGAVGPVFGSYPATLRGLAQTLRAGGLLVMDDAFVEDGREPVPGILFRAEMNEAIAGAGFSVLACEVPDPAEMRQVNLNNEKLIRARVEELAVARPEIAELVRGYVRSQEQAGRLLEEKLRGAIWLLRKA